MRRNGGTGSATDDESEMCAEWERVVETKRMAKRFLLPQTDYEKLPGAFDLVYCEDKGLFFIVHPKTGDPYFVTQVLAIAVKELMRQGMVESAPGLWERVSWRRSPST